MKTRHPAVAGRFYPNNKKELSRQLNDILATEKSLINLDLATAQIIGAVVPHAGYMFSAYQAIHFFEILKHSARQFDTFFIINPNHTGYGKEISLDTNDEWETPFGEVEIDKDFCDLLPFSMSAEAHRFEHSAEVMLPMLQHHLNYKFKIVPITLSYQNPENANFIAKSIVKVNAELNKKICIIASSDFSHYVHPDEGKRLDDFVIRQILDFNAEGVYREVTDKDISVCGYGPIMTLIEYSKMITDDPKVKILKAGHSGEIMPSDEVVDYVSILFYTP